MPEHVQAAEASGQSSINANNPAATGDLADGESSQGRLKQYGPKHLTNSGFSPVRARGNTDGEAEEAERLTCYTWDKGLSPVSVPSAPQVEV